MQKLNGAVFCKEPPYRSFTSSESAMAAMAQSSLRDPAFNRYGEVLRLGQAGTMERTPRC